MTMPVTPNEWLVLLHTPPHLSRGAPGREICKAAHGVSNARAVDRTIAVLRGICDKGLVRSPSSVYAFTTYFVRGYSRTEAGEAMVESHQRG